MHRAASSPVDPVLLRSPSPARLRAVAEEEGLIGRSPAMLALLDRVGAAGGSEVSVVIRGESGTGKELVARILHRVGARAGQPFVAVNCAAFPDTLIDAELFGHARGAFTGAVGSRPGRFRAADGGTLFLDEVGELSLAAQAKLLRVLQERAVVPLGSDRSVPVDVRIISATHRDLRAMVDRGRFREDLYYRLKVLELHLPAVRERRADVPLLVKHFARGFAKGPQPGFTDRAWRVLADYDFPGNVRELKHAVEHAVVLAQGETVDLDQLPTELLDRPRRRRAVPVPVPPLAEAVSTFERGHIVRALRACGGQRTSTARLLGISRKCLWEKMRNHAIQDEEIGAS